MIAQKTVKELIELVASRFELTPDDVCGRSHAPRVVRARHQLWQLLRFTGRSLNEIGRFTGHHHTTVLAGIRTCTMMCKGCGCTDDAACEGGCYWVNREWCSECEAALGFAARGAEGPHVRETER